jgi:hypothetical protein
MQKISSGARYKHNQTWHEELQDKLRSIITNARWTICNCDGDPQKLKDDLLNCIDHHKNNHTNCHPEARCKRQGNNHEPSCVVITSPVAERLLRTTLMKMSIYKKTADYALDRNTYYVESLNNTMLKFHDKRIVCSNPQYEMRSNLAILHWNENVDRECTSYWKRPGAPVNRYCRGKRVLKPATYMYRTSVWERYVASLYQ